MKEFLLSFIVLSSLSTFAQDPVISEKNLKKHVKFLASDKLKGRGTGTVEEKKAADYIAKHFEKYGLTPFGFLCLPGDKQRRNTYYHSFSFKFSPDPHDTSEAKKIQRTGVNVVGFLDNGAEHTIVIGAHYDHLGMGHDHNSMDPNPKDKIHNGADDNASGTAGVLELARHYSENNVKEKYNFLFMCFSGEELGLFGSKKFVENPTIDLLKVNCMINMDMIGRLNDSTRKLIIYGVGTAPDFVPIIDGIKTGMSVKKDSAGIGPSDQTSFYLKNIPVLHFFTGQHSDYHRPSDDVDKVNFPGEVNVLMYIIDVISELEKRPKLKFLTTRNPDTGRTTFKVTMGVMPDYTFEGKGMRVDGVTDGKPAFKAGIVKGDVVVQIGEMKIDTMKDYMKALGQHKKGDTVPVIVLREGKEVKLKVTF